MTWTVARIDTTCGACGAAILALEPMALMLGMKCRCRPCGEKDGEYDAAAVDTALQRLFEETRPPAEPAPTLATARPTRVPLKRPLQSFSKIADGAGSIFDPRAAQANDHD